MGLLGQLIPVRNDSFTVNTEPDIRETTSPALDTQAIPLMLLVMMDYDKQRGYRHHQILKLHTFIIEETLERKGVELNRYDWEPAKTSYGPLPYSDQFYADLYDGFTSLPDSKPCVRTRDTKTFGGDPVRYYTVTGYTDLYIQKYFNHANVSYEMVERVVRDQINETSGITDLRDRIVELDPDTYF